MTVVGKGSLRLATLLCGVLFLSACDVKKPVQITDAWNGMAVHVTPGRILELQLPENPSTGYAWTEMYEPDSYILRAAGKDYRVIDPIPGRGGVVRFHYVVVGSGRTVLRMLYSRPWVSPDQDMNEKVFWTEVISWGIAPGGNRR